MLGSFIYATNNDIDRLDTKIDEGFAAVDTKFAAQDTKIDEGFDAVDAKFAAQDTKIGGIRRSRHQIRRGRRQDRRGIRRGRHQIRRGRRQVRRDQRQAHRADRRAGLHQRGRRRPRGQAHRHRHPRPSRRTPLSAVARIDGRGGASPMGSLSPPVGAGELHTWLTGQRIGQLQRREGCTGVGGVGGVVGGCGVLFGPVSVVSVVLWGAVGSCWSRRGPTWASDVSAVEHPLGVADQIIYEPRPLVGVVPVTHRPGPSVVVMAQHQPSRRRRQAAHTPNPRADHRDRVLGRDRVEQHRGVQRPHRLVRQRPALSGHLAHQAPTQAQGVQQFPIQLLSTLRTPDSPTPHTRSRAPRPESLSTLLDGLP